MEIPCVVVLVGLLSVFLPSVDGNGPTNGYFSFQDTSVLVTEASTTLTLNIQRRAGRTGQVTVGCEFSDNDGDFVGSTAIAPFNQNETSKPCSFTVKDDSIPEGNETFVVKLKILSGGGELENPQTCNITILANDKAYGVIGFSQRGQITIPEPTPVMQAPVNISLTRSVYSYGPVSVRWEFVPGGNDESIRNFEQTSGTVSFADGQSKGIISLRAKADNIAENDQVYNLRLTSVYGGAELNSSYSDLQILIPANDARVRFPVTSITVPENISTVDLEVYRGLEEDGVTEIGNVQETATINWYVVPGNTQPGQDFENKNGTITFASGETKKTIQIRLLNDKIPELAENFSVHLETSMHNVYIGQDDIAMVTILPNDDQHGVFSFAKFPKLLDEDGTNSGDFFVNRTAGTFGNVSLSWRITGGLADLSSVFEKTSGILVFAEGEFLKTITVVVRKDSAPEEAVEYFLELSNPTGGSRLGNTQEARRAVFVVSDSDSVYGVIEFASQDRQRIIQSTTPRQLSLEMARIGGSLRSISVNYSIEFYPPGSNSPSNELNLVTSGHVTFSSGQTNASFSVDIPVDSFLKFGSVFKIQLLDTQLTGDAPIVQAMTPKVGNRSVIYLNVTAKDADGEIGFGKLHQTIRVQEPEGPSPRTVNLLVVRDGTAGRATAEWNISSTDSSFNASDIGANRGRITFEKGQNAVNLSIIINPDDVPELDESFVVTLSNVSSRNRLQAGMESATVTILENDNPGGTFEFQNTSSLIIEEGNGFEFTVVRRGSSLDRRSIAYEIRPAHDPKEFLGDSGVIDFPASKLMENKYVFVSTDSIPELDEHYRLVLYPYQLQGASPGTLGENIAINITVPANDDPYGIIEFAARDAVKRAVEVKGKNTTVNFEVRRNKGTFGTTDITWVVLSDTDDAKLDIYPTSGVLRFLDKQQAKNISIYILTDKVPEKDETYTIHLPNKTGQASFGTPRNATLIINKNDDPIYFEPTLIKVSEGQTANLTIRRGGDGLSSVTVTYSTFDGTARATDGDFTPISLGRVSFGIGEFNKSISVVTNDDVVPEGVENLTVKLLNSTGDTVLQNDVATISIYASDAGTGLFEFVTLNKTITEGGSARYEITRSIATHGVVHVYWQVFRLLDNGSLATIPSGDDVTSALPYVVFADGDDKKDLEITASNDDIAEMDETFVIKIINATGIETGENGRLGNQTTAYLTVLSNDDPYGKLLFPSQSRDVKIPEDFEPGLQNTTIKNLTVTREQGDWGDIQVIWEISQAGLKRPDDTYDLLFLGDVRSGVTKDLSKRRDKTHTNVYCFDASRSGSYATVSSLNGLSNDEITISSWLQPAKSTFGYVLSYGVGGTVVYALAVNTTASTSSLFFEFGDSNVTVDLGQEIADSRWHMVVITLSFVSNGQAIFYLDGQQKDTRTFPQRQVDTSGTFTVGALQPDQQKYTGCIQDIRIQPAVLEGSTIKQISTSITDFNQLNGYIDFPAGVRNRNIEIRTIDDITPEGNELFSVILLAPKGGAALDNNHAETTLTVLKSDNANGLFGFGSTSPITLSETSNQSITIKREKGLADQVTVSWGVYKGYRALELASDDFQPYQGSIVFADQEKEKNIFITPRDDNLPELDEHFVLKLVSSETGDSENASTPTSGASLDPNLTSINITVIKNDFPYGLLQFMDRVPAWNDTIPPAVDAYYKDVRESSGSVELVVVRAQGVEGEVKCFWKIEGQSAKPVDDYVDNAGVLTFGPGVRKNTITITLKDDNVPELNKTFKVVLYNPTGGANLSSVASTAKVNILPSDDAFGVLNFTGDSIKRTVEESASVSLTVMRVGGTLGPVAVYWKAIGPHQDDLAPMSGSVELPTGRNTAQVQFRIADDVTPELSESYLIQLVNVSSGRLASSGTVSNITIIASDHPYGIFQFNRSVISVTESNRNVTLVAKRDRGVLGAVRVYYETMNSGDMFGNVRQKAMAGQDFVASNGYVDFSEGQTNASFVIQLLDDVIPEDEETVLVNLTRVEIVKHSPVIPVPTNSPVIGRSNVAQIRILKNDNASGVFQLSASSVYVTEPYSHAIVNVTRTAGNFGEVTVYFVVDRDSASTSDYHILYNNITFQDGQTTASVPIEIVDDNVPEYNETFTIRLQSTDDGDALLGSPLECRVTVAENDYPYGLIEFKSSSLSVETEEPSGGLTKSVRLDIERTFGTDGTTKVYWEAMALNGHRPSSDVSPVSGSLLFPPGSSGKTLTFDILSDDYPEIDEVIQIHLMNVTSGKAKINPLLRVANITILANDEPHGVIHFTRKAYDVIEGKREKTMTVYLEVKRDNGTFGDLRLYYSTVALPNSSIPDVDYKSESNASIIIPDGNSTTNIPITLLNDTIPELSEMFQVILERVEMADMTTPALPPRLAEPKKANVTILSNDDANGLFVIVARSPDPGTDGSRKTLEEGNTSVGFIVKRVGGQIGTVAVSWEISSTSNATRRSDYIGDGATWTFRPGEVEKTATIEILDDAVPETDEAIVIMLTNPTNGAKVSSGVGNNLTIVISANDVVAGKVGFNREAQSVVVNEGTNVSLLVERSSPAALAGRVTVSWTIIGGNAERDFDPFSGNLTFSQYQRTANITFQVTEDAHPEPNEVFTVELTSIKTHEIAASGAAILIADQTTATISIQASDEPHGVVEFQESSRILRTDEDKNVTLIVSRLFGTIGSIRVYYRIQNASAADITADQQKLAVSGVDFTGADSFIDIANGKSLGEIPVHIINENLPELAELFIVNITGVQLLDSPHNTSGGVPRVGQNRTARVIINSNDNPKGLLGFTKKRYYINESAEAFDVIVERIQGTLGNISVEYRVESQTAIRGKDFYVPAYSIQGDNTLKFYDGEREKNITIYTKDDSIPEDDENFMIALVRVDNPLRYGYTRTDVYIRHNDDARGVFSFSTTKKTISEPGNGATTSATFKVVRKIAQLGTVVVGWRVVNSSASLDVSPVNGTMEFKKDISEREFTINSLLDSHPEKDEVFVIELSIVSSDGGRVEEPYQATLTVSENDYPYGELQITSAMASTSTVTVEETTKTVKAKVSRKKGSFGRITVDYQTVPNTAVSTSGDLVHFETIQGLKTTGAQSWYSFSAYGVNFLVLASNSSGDVGEFSWSALYRWQGVYRKIQSIPTDGAVNCDSFTHNGSTYLAIANYGEEGRTETMSSVYRLDRDHHLTLVQNISTQGATDIKFFSNNQQLYLVIANQKSNAGETKLHSKVYKMQDGFFKEHSNLEEQTRAASGLAVFTINGNQMLAVSNFYDRVGNTFSTKSPIFRWNGNQFVLSQPELSTNGPVDVEYFVQGGQHFLVFANTRGDVTVHQWTNGIFTSMQMQSIPAVEVKAAKTYTYNGQVRLSILDGNDELKVYSRDSPTDPFVLQMNTTLRGASSVQPVVISDPFAGEVQMLVTAVSGTSVSPVLVPVNLSPQADFIPRKGQLTFEDGQTELELDFSILQDTAPEKDETFSIVLSNATGKAVIGPNKQLTVTILSNDNAHGRVGFSDASLKKIQPELNQDTVVSFEVVREVGQFGRVVVLWNLTGNFSPGEVTPVSGALVFENGEKTRNISLTVHQDDVPELDKEAQIRLIRLNETGSSEPGRGALINTARALATLIIPGNDEPHGIIGWSNTLYLSQEANATNKSITLTITRQRGLIGGVVVSYQTVEPIGGLRVNEQAAVAGVDFVAKDGTIVIPDGVNSTQISLEILHGNLSPQNKLFYVNITAVALSQGSPTTPLVTNSPRVDIQTRLLEVVLSKINESLGELSLNVSESQIEATEGSNVLLEVVRTGSLVGEVGLHYTVRPRTIGPTSPASISDYYQSDGTLYFRDGETSKIINITVIDDGIPEVDEAFYVSIERPINGVKIGSKSRVDVVIKANDDPYGVFGFTVSSSTVQEGTMVRLVVQRLGGAFREVHVTWSMSHDAASQISPFNGTLTFEEGDRVKEIVLLAINDSVPESLQQYTCSLETVDNEAKINATHKTVAVLVPANDKAEGIISIDPSTRNLLVGEPGPGYNGVFEIRILRSVGQIGTAYVDWEIRPNSAGSSSSPANTFNASSGQVIFTTGVESIPVVIQVNDDPNPEEFASYLFKITVSGADSAGEQSLQSIINVAASDDPYGLFTFNPPLIRNVSEKEHYVNLTVKRNKGDIGNVVVNFTVTSPTATAGKDYEVSSYSVNFADKDESKQIFIKVKNDSEPELEEVLLVRLEHVTLSPTRHMNYTILGGLSPDQPPRIGTNRTVEITIEKNDKANGVIQLTESTKDVRERNKQVVIGVERVGGAIGRVVVHFTVLNGSAAFGEDYNQSAGSVTFDENQTTANITIPIIDDSKPEHRETFSVVLDSVSGGAALGSARRININILTSDNPYGLVGFVNSTNLQLPNPNTTRTLRFGISRSDGAQGSISVKWQLIRKQPSSGSLSDDFIGPVFDRVLNFADGDGSTQYFDLKLRPYTEPEPQEIYLLYLSDLAGGATLDEDQSNITITVLKHGFPNGKFAFKDTSSRVVTEPNSGMSLNLPLTVERTVGFQGEVKDNSGEDSYVVNKEGKVYWQTIGADREDLGAISGVLTFGHGVRELNLDLEIKGDDTPELNETFVVMLYRVDGGGDLIPSKQNITVTIRANDDPHGVFKLKSGAQGLVVSPSSRQLNITVQRDRGTFGDVTIDYSVTYSSWYPGNLDGSVTVPDGDTKMSTLITLSGSAFLAVGSSFQIRLTNARYISSQGLDPLLPPRLSSTDLQATIHVPETAANGLFSFAPSSTRLTAATADNQVSSIMIVRQGLYGSVSVRWSMGYPPDSTPQGYTAGSIEPTTGNLLFTPGTRNATFSVKATPNMSPTSPLVYAIHLQSATSSVPGGANVTSGSYRTAVIEYSGVVEFAPDSRSQVVTEGGQVTCRLVRFFSIFGNIRVHYSAPGVTGTVTMADGEYTKNFTVTSLDNDVAQQGYSFYINITRVTGGDSPRLGTNTAALINVRDNDDANGIFSFKTTSIKVPENATSGNTRTVELTIQRTGGTLGAVSVVVRTVGGGEPWDKDVSPKELKDELAKRPKDANATVGNDYTKLEQRVNFNSAFPFPSGGQSKTIQLTILEDSAAEPDEKVYLYLTDATGGARLATSSDKLQSWAVVTIEGNDLMNGEIGFISGSQSATIDEDGASTATLKLERRGAKFGRVTVLWRVREADKRPQVEEYQGTVTFDPDVMEQDLVIRIKKDSIPEFKYSFHVDLVELQNTLQARIIPSASSAVITVLDSDYPYGMVGFSSRDLYKPVNLKTTEVILEVVRSYGNTTDVTVTYGTEMLPGKSTESGISTSQAVVKKDYQPPSTKTLRFKPGETTKTISVTLTPETPSDSAYPKAFRIKILNVTNKAVINTQTSRAMVIISDDEETTRFLALRATSRLYPLTDKQINKILADLKIYVKKPLNEHRLSLTKDTIKNILDYKKNRPLMLERKLQDISKTTLMDIFDELLKPTRSDTRGKVDLAPIFKMFAFSLVYGTSCPTKDSLGLKGKYAYATAYRNPPSMLNGLQLKSVTGKHYFSYPSNMYIGVDSSQSAQCNDVHFIEYHTSHWFEGAVLNDKVLSTSLNDTSTLSKSMNPYTYMIYSSNRRVTPKGAKCVYWDFDKAEWSTAGCSVKSDKEDFVECQCNHMSNFAAQGQSDDRVGYSTYFFVACFVCMGAFAFALLSHHACSVDNLFSAKLLMHMFFACMAAQLMYVVGAYVSSSQAVITEDPPVRCSVLGMFIHYFFLCQFSWMFIQGWNLWRILVLNDEHTDRKYVLFFVLGWGIPVVIIVLYIIVAQAAFSWNLHQMYGDVHMNGDMCFIPNAYAALSSVVVPALLFLMFVAVVFTQAYQVTMQWRYYDDIYRGHYNIKEVRNVIILFVAVAFTWLFAGLHLAYGYLWMIILFVILDVMLGLYVFILFFILRNQVRGVFKQTYAFRGEPPPIQTHDDFFRSQMGTEASQSGSSKRFKMRQSPDMPSEWDELDHVATPSSNRKLMVNMDDTGSFGRVNETFEDEMETQDFDDLIFALKTGGNFDPELDDEKDPPYGSGAEHFELRRISIPDTHL